MAIKVNAGFLLQSPAALDEKAYLTKAQMLAANDALYPDYYMVLGADDGLVYVYNKNMAASEQSAETGKFKLMVGDAEADIAKLKADVNTEGSVLNSIYKNAKNGAYATTETTTETIDMTAFSVDNIVITKAQLDAIKATPDTAVEVETGYELTYVSADGSYTITDTAASDTKTVTITEDKVTTVTTIHKAIENLAEAAEVKLETLATATEGYLKTYEIKQGDKSVGKIDIPKDMVVSSGAVIEIEEDATTAGTFNVKGDTKTYTATEVADKKNEFFGYPVAAGTFLKLVITNQDTPIFIDAAALVDTGSLGKTTEDITANVEVGGIANGAKIPKGSDLEDFIKQLLTKYYAPGLTLTGSVSNKVQRKGTTLTNVDFTAVATKNSEKITSLEINGVAQTSVEDGGTFTETVASITDTTTISATVTDGKTPVTKSVKYTFVLPYMYGVSSKATIDADSDLTALTEVVEVEGKKSFAYTAANQYLVFVQPAGYAALDSIVDQNGFDNTDSFTVGTYTNADGETYRTYISKLKSTCSSFKYDFK